MLDAITEEVALVMIPDTTRFGSTPLFIDHSDILKSVDILEDILKTQSRKEDRFRTRAAVI